jgi:hypothetical protein
MAAATEPYRMKPTEPSDRPRYRLELVALPHVDQPAYALRQLLRRALRNYGLKCTSVEEIPPEESQ